MTTTTVAEAAARTLNAIADDLDTSATITHPVFETETPRCMTQGLLDAAMWAASGAVDSTPNARLRTEARAAARELLPPVEGTVAEYATRLRAISA
ncbi:hypothetical protein [Streptomyces sp. NPDC055733]